MSNPQLPGDDILIPKLLEKDEATYRDVVKAYHGMMVYVAKSIVGDAIADEVAQESWVSVMKALPKFERRSTLKTWIMRIVSNTAKSRLRHESRTVNVDNFEGLSESVINPERFKEGGHWAVPPSIWQGDSPESLLASEQLQGVIDKALKDLGPLQRSVVSLRDIQGLDMDTICKILEVSESNARVLLHRARSQIREAIDQFQKAQV